MDEEGRGHFIVVRQKIMVGKAKSGKNSEQNIPIKMQSHNRRAGGSFLLKCENLTIIFGFGSVK